MIRLERRHQALLPRGLFARRLLAFAGFSLGIVALSLYLGMAGFHYLEHLGWLDSLLNASMLLGGMGPVTTPQTDAGKYFASAYSLFSGMVFLVAFGVLVTPIAHRIFHAFHVDTDEEEKPKRRKRR
jgi:hypothetical protein